MFKIDCIVIMCQKYVKKGRPQKVQARMLWFHTCKPWFWYKLSFKRGLGGVKQG